MRVRNFESGKLKVNDSNGSPIEIAAVVVWQVEDTYKASFEVDHYEHYVVVQSEAAVRTLATGYPYDVHDEEEAVSLVGNNPVQYATAARVVVSLLERMQRQPLPSDTILNVNVPDVPADRLGSMQATRLGHRHKSEPVIPMEDPRGRPVYWVGPAGLEQDAGPGTDFHAVRSGHVSVTPLDVDLTRYTALEQVGNWLAQPD